MAEILIKDIEKELNKLWEAHGASHHVRASLFTLVVFSQDKNRTASLQGIIKTLVGKFPCRILFIQSLPDATNKLDVEVSHELTKVGDTSIACDYIVIQASPDQLPRVPFIATPLFLPDLPIYLFWDQDPTNETVVFPHLQPFASRIIFDSGRIHSLRLFGQAMLDLMEANPCLDIIDINWVRLDDWRKAIRQIFDSDSSIQHLCSNKGLKIQFNGYNANSLHPELQSFYFVYWLAERLKWQKKSFLQEDKKWLFTFSNGSNDFTITILEASHSQYSTGTVLEVEVAGCEDHFIVISPVDNASKVVVHISTAETCEIPFSLPMPSFKKDFPFIAQILFDRTSPHYKKLLQQFDL